MNIYAIIKKKLYFVLWFYVDLTSKKILMFMKICATIEGIF